MELLPYEVLDHIFSFLRSRPRSLLACSDAHPIFAQIVERYLYYHIIIPSISPQSDHRRGYRLELWRIIEVLSETPHINDYVRIMEITFKDYNMRYTAPIFSRFRSLQCIKLPYCGSWQSLDLRDAMADCLRLPTLQEVHFGDIGVPLSILEGRANITRISLSRYIQPFDGPHRSEFPQLESLFADNFPSHIWDCLMKWGKRHLVKLQSVTHQYSGEKFLELLGICSNSLRDLDVIMPSGSIYETAFDSAQQRTLPFRIDGRTPPETPKLDLSSLPSLRRLTVRVEVFFNRDSRGSMKTFSCLPAAVRICKTASRLQHLTIGICIDHLASLASLSKIDFYPLVDLAKISPSFDHVDIYVYSTHGNVHRVNVLATLSKYEEVEGLIERGVWVLHVQEVPPTDPRFIEYPSRLISKFYFINDDVVPIV